MEVVVAATIFQAVGSVVQGFQEADALKQSARLMEKQLQAENTNFDRSVAVEGNAAAQESLERTKRLRRTIGSTLSAGAYAGLSTDIGVINAINEGSQFEAGREEGLARSNLDQRLTSLRLDNAATGVNLNSQIGQARAQASSAVLKGFMGAAQSAGSFYNWKSSLGSATGGAANGVATGTGRAVGGSYPSQFASIPKGFK